MIGIAEQPLQTVLLLAIINALACGLISADPCSANDPAWMFQLYLAQKRSSTILLFAAVAEDFQGGGPFQELLLPAGQYR